MLIYRKETPYFALLLDLTKHELKITQRWRYTWMNGPNTSGWTYQQKKKFHDKVDRLIWSIWGSKFFLKVVAGAKLPAGYKPGTITAYFDIKWVTDSTAHWKATVTKIKPGTFKQSYIRWAMRDMSLDTEDIKPTLKHKSGKVKHYQYGVAHEFGHTIGNVFNTSFGHGDEYLKGDRHFNDFPSIMNTGGQLRKRHLDFVKQNLNNMVPGVKFEVSHVK